MEGFDLVGVSGGLNNHGFDVDIYDVGAENTNHVHYVISVLGEGPELNQGKLTGHVLRSRNVLHFHNPHDLAKLSGGLYANPFSTLDYKGHAGQFWGLTVADGKAGDIEAAPAEQA